MVKTGLTLLTGNVATSLMLLLRNLGVAALIPVSDYGIAATFAIVTSLIEMASHLGLQQQIVQSDKGADPDFQAGAQGFHALRGVIAAVILFALAAPLARFMGVGHVAWAYQVLAIVPLAQAFQHFDMHRLNRDMVFGPLIWSSAVPALLSLLTIWPLAWWLGDYRVMLWSIVLHAVLMLVMSHVVARRPYRLVINLSFMRSSLQFGWPLLINGALLYLVFQGDKIIVGRLLGMEALAIFAMGATLTLTPTLVLAKSAQNFFLPQLKDEDPLIARATLEAAILVGIAVVIFFALFGVPMLRLLLGTKYQALEPLLIWMAVQQGIRFCKVGPAIVTLARGKTAYAMWANTPRVAALPIVWWAATAGVGLTEIIWIGIGAEIVGLIIAWRLLGPSGISPQFKNIRRYMSRKED